MARLFANNATSTLASDINGSDNTLLLETGAGARFPSPASGDHFSVTLTQGIGLEESWEIVKVTARSGDTLTVTRAQEGTSAAAWPAGAKAELRLTKEAMEDAREWSAETVSQAEAEAGTATTRRAWTAQRVRQAIAAWWSTVTLGISDISGLGEAINAKLSDAASNGKPYARQNGQWVEVDSKDAYTTVTQNSRSANYTLTLADAGRHILHPGTDTSARTFTIPSNASVPYKIGTAITFVNQNGTGGVVTIVIASDTMRLAGSGTTGSRTLARNGVATALKIAATEWIISGVGLT